MLCSFAVKMSQKKVLYHFKVFQCWIFRSSSVTKGREKVEKRSSFCICVFRNPTSRKVRPKFGRKSGTNFSRATSRKVRPFVFPFSMKEERKQYFRKLSCSRELLQSGNCSNPQISDQSLDPDLVVTFA